MKKTSLYRRFRRIFGALLLLACCASASARVIYVDADAPGANDGTSWENAYNFLQDALADANDAAEVLEIRVAQGVYTPDSNSTFPEGTGDREACFQLIDKVTLAGGYAGFEGEDPNARDISLYETILSGDLAGDDGPGFANYHENSYHVVLARWVGIATVFEGFTVTAGNATGTFNGDVLTLGVHHDCGGGMYCSLYVYQTQIRNCIFRKNKATWGAGLYSGGDLVMPRLENCVFSENKAMGGAGAFTGGLRNYINSQSSEAKFTNCIFEDNFADIGGAVYSQSFLSVSTLTDCYFEGNKALFYGGAIHNERGRLTLGGCNFVGNSTLVGGGLLGGGAVYSINAQPLNIANCIFSGNTSAAVGGAVYAGSCRPAMDPTTCGRDIGLSMSNSTFAGNRAAECGGAICFGIGRSVVSKCIFWGNIAPKGKEMALDPSNIVTQINYCCVEGGQAAVHYMGPDCRYRPTCPGAGSTDPNCSPTCSLVWATGASANIEEDPCFADPGYWNENGTPDDPTDDFWVNGDYHLKSETGRWDPSLQLWVQDYVSSPCIDRGDTLSYVEPPPHSGYINLGAYGNTGEASKACFPRSDCGILIQGDLNWDCLVNELDFAIIANDWLVTRSSSEWCESFRAGNMDYHRPIYFKDFLIMAQHWLEGY